MTKLNDEGQNNSEEILISITWGKETLQPLQYHSMEIGPFQISKRVKRCDAEREIVEAYDEMEKWAEDIFEKKVDRFKDRVRRLNGKMRGER